MPYIELEAIEKASQADSASLFKKIEFIDLPQGQTTIRLLSKSFFEFFNHYINGAYVKCLNEDCPICASNAKLIMENPQNFRDIKGYSARNHRYAVNVLDKTLVKICPKCKAEFKKNGNNFPSTCTKCDTVLLNELEQVLNRVKVLSKGPTLTEQLKALQQTVLNASKEPVGITNFDIVLYVTGSGKGTNITPIPLTNETAPVDVKTEQLFDLEKATLVMTADEVKDVMRGVSLKDIFAARKATKDESFMQTEKTTVAAEVVQSVMNILDK
jgi:hypothetical protein